MKTLFPFILFLFISKISNSQDYHFKYYLDANLNSVDRSIASIVGKGIRENGLLRLDCFSITGNQLYMTIHFIDSTLADLEGSYKSYHRNGKLERQGNYEKGFEEGLWQDWDSLGMKTDSIIYQKGLPVITATFNYNIKGTLTYFSLKDSLRDTYQTSTFDANSILISTADFKGKKGIVKTYKNGIQVDSVFTREETEARFDGGNRAWSNFLMKNLNANVPVNNGAPAGTYNVMVRFIVKTDGSIGDVSAETNFGYGMENEVVRIIKNGPKWIPANQYGRKVTAYRRQPVTFMVSSP